MLTRADLHKGLVRLCQDYGYVTDHTYELIDSVIASIHLDPDDEDAEGDAEALLLAATEADSDAEAEALIQRACEAPGTPAVTGESRKATEAGGQPPLRHGTWVTSADGNVRVCFDYIGEGHSGEYGDAGDEDEPLLRLDVNVRVETGYDGEPTGDDGWLYPPSGSVCTNVHYDTDGGAQADLLTYAAEEIANAVRAGDSVRSVTEGRLSWLPQKVPPAQP